MEIKTDKIGILKENAHEVEYHSWTLKEYIKKISDGNIRVPLFQRKFVWTQTDIISFLNALITNAFPFGNIVCWEDQNKELKLKLERNEYIKQFKSESKRESSNDSLSSTTWILDGQQRTTTIISQLINPKNTKITSTKHKNLYFSFDKNQFVKGDTKNISDGNCIHVHDLLSTEIKSNDLCQIYGIHINVATDIIKLRKKIWDIKIGVTSIKNTDLNNAINIFTEMNSKGKKLTFYDIACAKWHALDLDINLEKQIKQWKEKVDYEPDDKTILQTIYILLDKNVISSADILKYDVLKKDEFQNATNQKEIKNILQSIMTNVWKALDKAHDFLISDMNFKPELIPSSNLIKFLAYFYYKNTNEKPTSAQIRNIKMYIKKLCLDNAYTKNTNSVLKSNIKMMDKIFETNNFANNDENSLHIKELSPEDICNIKYKSKSSLYYYIINLLFQEAKSFENSSKIPTRSVHKKNSIINIHHIIPKSLKFGENKVKIKDIDYGNSIANLAPILADENKNINNKYPKKYLEEFAKKNDELENTLTSLYIHDSFKTIDKNTKINSIKTILHERAEKIADVINENNVYA